MSSLRENIILAQSGHASAFEALVRRFETMCVAYASTILKDPELALDVVQDALVEAHDKLAQLEAPEAFSAWLRRIVFKHCDRRLRRKPAPQIGPTETTAAPDDAVQQAQFRAAVRAAVEALPEHERLVVALHYFAECPQRDVAEFLELPLSTVKKRLYSARRRLETALGGGVVPRPSEPSPALAMADRITLFLAIRSQDHAAVARCLDRHPDWVNQGERWTREQALQGDFTLAHRLTPLILASGRGDMKMVQLLLDRSAEVDGLCGCDAGETALLAAVIHGRTQVAEHLLSAGADPNRTNRAGYAALHIAYMRGHSALVPKLLQAGADPQLRAHCGRSPQECAPSLTAAVVDSQDDLHTGIKGLDLLAPLSPGMRVRVHGEAETGLMVLLTELSYRLAQRGWSSVWATRVAQPWQRYELSDTIAQAGLRNKVRVCTDGLAQISGELGDRVALFVFREPDQEAEADVAVLRAGEKAGLTFVIDPWRPVTRGELPKPELAAPFDALICTDPALAAAGIYPALDLQRTASRHPVHDRQTELQSRVRAAAADPLVQAYLSQPFFVAQHDNGMFGQDVSPEQTLQGFSQIVDGAVRLAPADVKYRGALPRMSC